MPTAASHPFTREKLLQIARSLPADLQVLSALGEMLQDVNSELDEIAGLLRRDVALAARIVRISNSPVFGGGGQVASVEEAVNRVGFSEILKLVGTATAARFSERALDHYDVGAHKLRDNMLYTALVAEAVARFSGQDPRAAYTAGLLRTLGLMVLDRAGRGHVALTERYSIARWPSYSAWEGALFGIDHCELTGIILDEWRFPTEIGGAVRGHYLARRADFDRPLACVLHIASAIGQRSDRALVGEAVWWDITSERLRCAGVDEGDLDEITVSANNAFESALLALAA